ncbi:MAG: 3-deoxy-D-manno-octulosonic acid transferase [Nitrospirae bacterium]|nr:3-deoxy-D-manno-octulosonic acid transferase [Candidatus Manganitrophaceae bacterium]
MKRIYFGLYQILILLSLPAALLFLLRRLAGRPAYRAGVMQRLGRYPTDFFAPLRGKRVIWVHAVSVGEVISSELFVRKLRERYPEAAIVFSTVTPTGQAAARQRLRGVDRFLYFPFDLPWVTRSVVEKVSPTLFIFLETELWPNFLRSLSKKKIPSILINGRISDRGFRRYRMIRFFLSHVLEEVGLFLMQTEREAERIRALGAPAERVSATGNMKYDQAAGGTEAIADFGLRMAELAEKIGLRSGERLMIAGSTHEGEEAAVLDAYRILSDDVEQIRLLIAPRHLERLERVERLLLERGVPFLRKTVLAERSAPDAERNDFQSALRPPPSEITPRVVLLDTIGELDRYYALADLVFVGGSLAPIGGHNVLEAAVAKKAVFFGPHMSNFKEIADQLRRAGGGIEVADGKAMGGQMLWLIRHPEELKKRGEAAYQVVLANRGAVLRNLEQVGRWLEN